MKGKFKIIDSKNNTVVVEISGPFPDNPPEYLWYPMTPGRLRSDCDEYACGTFGRRWEKDFACDATEKGHPAGKIFSVLRMNSLFDGENSPNVNKSGSGILYAEGCQTMIPGDMTWKKL
jgi:hypothetical protein